ncbi:MAG: carbohydrate kinase, YjeF related protein [Bryobacterales bacterium]|nr:carbohydrate kinase, YjeF related protein [Bryobacterales bacterium]
MKPCKVLTPAQMKAVDQATIAAGIPGLILMENAAHAVVDYIAEKYVPVSRQRIVVVCGKGGNGGDGLAVARILHVRFRPEKLWILLACETAELTGDAAANLRMLTAAGLQLSPAITAEMGLATLVVDAVLGTGLNGPAGGPALDAIRLINAKFPAARVVSVDIPSGLSGSSGAVPGEYVHAHATVTFTAPKLCHALAPAANLMGDLRISPIGSNPALFEDDPAIDLALVTPESIRHLFAPRPRDGNKGRYGHVLIIAGSRGKSGAAAMCALAALRSGAGLVTVACPASALASIAAFAPELMTEALPETDDGLIDASAYDRIIELSRARNVVAVGPGLGQSAGLTELVARLFTALDRPLVVDADALNALAGSDWHAPLEHPRVLTPHPGEMSRLTGDTIATVQQDRIAAARKLSTERQATIVLKGERTLLGFPDGRVWVNPTGTPAMATGGTGDILTGMVAGLLGQFPSDVDYAIAGAVYLHGSAGELAASDLGEQPVIATDLLRYFPEGIRGITKLPNAH